MKPAFDNTLFFLSGFSFMVIHKSQDRRGRRTAFLELLTNRHFDISWVITAESSPLHIGSSQGVT